MPVISLFGGAGNGAGFSYSLDLASQAAGDPGAGKVRFNNADLTAATAIYISNTEAGGHNILAFLQILDDSGSANKATIAFGTVPNPADFIQYTVTAANDETDSAYTVLTVSYLVPATAPTFTDGQSVAFGGIPTGQGEQGPQGAMSGVLQTFSTTTTDADPGNGNVRTSRASWTLGQTGWIYADNLDANGVNVAAAIQTFDDSDSSPRGGVNIVNTANAAEFLAFAITGDITVASGYDKIPVQYVAGAGSITNGASIAMDPKYTGDKGEPGIGMRMQWATGTSDADPGAGYIAANNATLTSATALYINDADANGTDLTAWLGTWDDSTNTTVQGSVWIKDRANTDKWLTAEVTATSDDGNYFDVTIQNPVAGGTAFAADDNVAVTFVRAGDKGADGAGAGDVVGPASAMDNAVVRYDSTTGKLIQNSGVTVDDSNNVGGVVNITLSGTVDGRDVAADGTKLDGVASGATANSAANVSETNTGTDTAKFVTPDGLAGSNYGTAVVNLLPFDDATDVATGDGAGDIFWRVPSILNGFDLVAVAASVGTAGTTGTTDIQIHNVTDAADMLSTKLTIDSGETDSSTAATAAVINTANDDVATGDKLRIDVDAVSTTAPQGLLVELQFRLP